ncbi:IS3 family transposase [Paenibacillus dendritiformis]|uniref:IS3 family transposase n=1 Tax=Paenibacillus dendritiformis TaxID=130049 RepID=UPI00248BDCC1|nr:IS3 family transposase [Paenibacillus dendritiformis]WGU96044.1 IS3 family transposase [Paenibacillus dendritiformis]
MDAKISRSRRVRTSGSTGTENGLFESRSFFSYLKGLYPYDIRSLVEAQSRIEEYIHFYNNRRPQRKRKKLTPVEYRRQLAACFVL